MSDISTYTVQDNIAAVTVTKGQLRFYDTVADSGNKISRGFCTNCGTPIMSKLESDKDILVIKLGALDDLKFFSPKAVFWTSTAHDWAQFPDGAIHFEENPPAGYRLKRFSAVNDNV